MNLFERALATVETYTVLTYSEFLSLIGIELSEILQESPEYIDVSTGDANLTLLSAEDLLEELENKDFYDNEVVESCRWEEEDRDGYNIELMTLLEEQWEQAKELLQDLHKANVYIDMEN